ncbi:MAG: signal peptidase I [Actinomycetota bacterium]|nr:signal peptidase I [Actinomycetota bacterium]
MTYLSYPQRATGRHVDTSKVAGWFTRHFSPAGFLQWMLVICLALFFWPATFGGRFGMVMVAGNSMEPTYNLGDAVFTWKEPVDIGDTILYRIPEGEFGEGNPVIHRVVGGDGNAWITQGDNSSRPDAWYPSNSDVLGIAQFHMPFGGRVLALMRSWLFIALLGGLAVGLVLWPDAVDEEEQLRRGRHRTI